MLKIHCWGSRGSIPVSGPQYARHGGATTCLEIFGAKSPGAPGRRIIIDCGTGLAALARRKSQAPLKKALFLQTHMHWDHLQGFPFFTPLFDRDALFHFLAVRRNDQTLEQAFASQMRPPFFPVSLSELPAQLNFETIRRTGQRQIGALTIHWTEMCHPSGSTAYRIDCHGHSLVFSGDVEVQMTGRQNLVDLAQGTDLLIMDAQYFADEYADRRGFGHSTPQDAVDVAIDAGASRLLMTHHDPDHDDRRLDQKLQIARDYAAQRQATDLSIDNACDGLQLTVGHPAEDEPNPAAEILPAES